MFVLYDSSAEGWWNMAVDEALLDVVRKRDVPVLRFYAWSEPTLSLGYFQRYEERFHHAGSREIAVVRRLSGGGAIVHDRELTYSLSIPSGHRLAGRERLGLYEAVHRHAIDILREWGFDAVLAAEVPGLAAATTPKEVFLCFQRFASGDVVVRSRDGVWVKILGSAQYRNRYGAVLQHGSLLWSRSDTAPELPGLKELGGENNPALAPLFEQRFREALVPLLSAGFNEPVEAFPGELRKEMVGDIEIIGKKRYAETWIRKK